MTRLRLIVLLLLFAAPFLFMMGAGGYHLWETGWMVWAWIPMFVCFASAYYFAWRWTKRGTLPPDNSGLTIDRDQHVQLAPTAVARKGAAWGEDFVRLAAKTRSWGRR